MYFETSCCRESSRAVMYSTFRGANCAACSNSWKAWSGVFGWIFNPRENAALASFKSWDEGLHWASLAPGGQGSKSGVFSAYTPALRSTISGAQEKHQRMVRL